jgi:hypothetical protein
VPKSASFFSDVEDEVGVLRGTEAKGYKAYDSWWELVQWCVEKSGSEPINAVLVTQEVVDFDKLGFRSTCRRRFFIPVKGYMGLAPAIPAPSDRIAVLFGCKVPHIVRTNESESPETTWTFIGGAYAHASWMKR